MTIPKVSINDLLAAGSASNPSATMTPSTNDMAGNFIKTLAKYASPVVSAVEGIPQDITNVANTVGKEVGSQQLIPDPIPDGPKVGPSIADTADTINEAVSGGTLPGPEFLRGEGTPMGLVALATAVEGGAENPEDTTKTAEDTTKAEEEGLPSIGGKGGGEKPPAPDVNRPAMITKNKADPQTKALMNLNFDVPRQVAQNMGVHPDKVYDQLIEDKITGRNLDDLQNVVDSITGEKGAFPSINNYILGKIKTPIDYTDALNSKNVNLPKMLEGEKPGLINEITKEVNKAMGPLNYEDKPSESGVSAVDPITGEPLDVPAGHAYASDLFQTSQNLREIARMYQRKAFTQMGDLNHPELLRAANAITEIKNNIDDAIDKAIPPSTYESFKSDPYVQEQLQRVPQTVADRWMTGATRFKDGQTIQAPYVNLGSMIEDTKDTQASVWTKNAKEMQMQRQNGGGGGQIVRENMPGPKIIKNIAGAGVDALGNIINKPPTPEDIFEQNMNAGGEPPASATMKGPSGGGPGGSKGPGGGGENPNNPGKGPVKPGTGKTIKVIAGLGLAGAAGAGLEAMQHGSNAQSDNHTNNSDNSHNGSVGNPPLSVNSQIETDMSKVDPKSSPVDPRSTTGTDGKAVAMSDAQYQTAIAALDALTKQDPSYITNPIKAGQLTAAKDAIQTKYKASQQLMQSYNTVSTTMQKIDDARNLLKDGAPWVTDKIGFLEGGHEIVNPKYQSLVSDLSFIENSNPKLKGQLSNLGTAESVKTALDNAARLILSEHNQLLKSYGAGQQGNPTTQTKTSDTTVVSPDQNPAGLPAPVNGALPPIHSGSYQFTQPNPLFK